MHLLQKKDDSILHAVNSPIGICICSSYSAYYSEAVCSLPLHPFLLPNAMILMRSHSPQLIKPPSNDNAQKDNDHSR